MAEYPGASGLYLKRDQEAVDLASGSTSAGILTGTLIGVSGSTPYAIAAAAHSGSAQVPAVGYALKGGVTGTWNTAPTERLDAIDNPWGVMELHSGVQWVPGHPLYLSGAAPINYSQVSPKNVGDIVQVVGMVYTAATPTSPARARINIGAPYTFSSSGTLIPWDGVAANDSPLEQ